MLAALLASTLSLLPGPGQADSIPPDGPAEIRTFKDDVSVCPLGDGDCHLTLVDHVLCAWLAEFFGKDEFPNYYNCLETSQATYVCLNILSRRKDDAEVGTDYTDPHLLELAADYEIELDQCLPGWRKSTSLSDAGQSIVYVDARRLVTLSILPFEADGTRYDRLTLAVRDSS